MQAAIISRRCGRLGSRIGRRRVANRVVKNDCREYSAWLLILDSFGLIFFRRLECVDVEMTRASAGDYRCLFVFDRGRERVERRFQRCSRDLCVA